MAGITQNVTPTSNKLFVYYRCSKCNHSNVHAHTIAGQSSNEKLAAKKNEILTQADQHNYKPAVFRCKCEKCGHVENWSKYNPPALEKCATVNLLLGILAIIAMLFGIVPWALAVTFFGIFLHACIISVIVDSARDKQVKAMDTKYLPIVASDMDTLKNKVAAAFPDSVSSGSNQHNYQPVNPPQQKNAYVHQAEKQPSAAKASAEAQPRYASAAPKQPEPARTAGVSAADEILKFKSLLDAGIITREEFEAKKKQLLRL